MSVLTQSTAAAVKYIVGAPVIIERLYLTSLVSRTIIAGAEQQLLSWKQECIYKAIVTTNSNLYITLVIYQALELTNTLSLSDRDSLLILSYGATARLDTLTNTTRLSSMIIIHERVRYFFLLNHLF